MKIPQAASNKYDLKSLHQEIDLYDRKLAHMDKYSPETKPADRVKILNRRNLLEKTARRLAEEGIEFEAKDLPRSFESPQVS